MAENRIERFTKTSRADLDVLTSGVTSSVVVTFAGREVPHIETRDFDTEDPWSKFKRQEIGKRRIAGAFSGKGILEFGSGDARNFREAGMDTASVIGVEKEEWRNAAGWFNLVYLEKRPESQVELWTGCAVDYLAALKGEKKKAPEWVIACLPQSPEGENTADRIDPSPNLASYKADWGSFGLELNAAVFENLRSVSTPALRALVIISGRVLPQEQARLFKETGWEILAISKTKEPVQQDPDTGVEYVQAYDDGERFWEKANGIFRPIDAVTAEKRRLQSLKTYQGRNNLNVYHDLIEFEVAPRR